MFKRNSILLFTLFFVFISFSPFVFAEETTWTAENSDPSKLGWMQGAPPKDEHLIMQPQSDFFSFPKLRWTVCHIRELMPTKQVSKGLDASRDLPYALNTEIDEVEFRPSNSKQMMTWKESLDKNFTDGMLIIHKGKIVYEKYSGCLNPLSKHAAMSMTKSLTGLLAEVLIAEGKLDDSAQVSSIIPELKKSAFGDATVRQVMNMTTALDYSEDYSDPNADIWIYSQAASPLPKPQNYNGPNGYFEYLQTVKKDGQHGETFAYKTINTDTLGWIIAKVSGQSLDTLLSQRIWQQIGAEQDAYFTIDSKGTPFAGGGISAGLRDYGRFGLMVLNQGELFGNQVVPAVAIKSIREGGDKSVFQKAGYTALPGGSYKSMWWILHNSHGAFAARGVHGQTIYIDPTADMVIVRLASYPKAANKYTDPFSLPAYQAVAEYLMESSAH